MNGPQWPKGNSVSWDTLPPLYVTLCKTGLIPEKFITSGSHWDPFYLNGNVAKVLSSLGFDIRLEKEDFWDVWPTVLTKDTYIITNPPFGSGMLYWFRAFFTFIVKFDNPFVLILPNYKCSRQYFKKAFSRIARPNEFHIFSIENSFPLIRKDRESVQFLFLLYIKWPIFGIFCAVFTPPPFFCKKLADFWHFFPGFTAPNFWSKLGRYYSHEKFSCLKNGP